MQENLPAYTCNIRRCLRITEAISTGATKDLGKPCQEYFRVADTRVSSDLFLRHQATYSAPNIAHWHWSK